MAAAAGKLWKRGAWKGAAVTTLAGTEPVVSAGSLLPSATPLQLIDGNDATAVYSAVRTAVERAARAEGPTLIEAITYRIEAHTNADDATRYRASDEVRAWLARDPITRLEAYLRAAGLLGDQAAARLSAEAEQFAQRVRDLMNGSVDVGPGDLFDHVYAQPTASLEQQRAALLAEIADGRQ